MRSSQAFAGFLLCLSAASGAQEELAPETLLIERIKAKMADREIDSGGLETLVLIKTEDGAWRIRHSHTSSRPRRTAAQ